MSASPSRVLLEYSGPPALWLNEDHKSIELVAGRRYQIPSATADHWLEQNTGHWKRPEPPSEPRAAKE